MVLRIGMIQSNYLPWRGYFDFIDDVDLFIIYDHVQYTRHDWRNRNRIKTTAGSMWITVPVQFSRTRPTSIDRTPIDGQSNWTQKHTRSIQLAYQGCPYFKTYFEEFTDMINGRFQNIGDLNVTLIKWVMKHLGIHTPIRHSREYSPTGRKTDMIIDILKKVGATDYLVGPAAKGYLEEQKFRLAGIGLEYKSYDYAEYPQMHGPFDPVVSVIDLLFNCGPESRKYLKSRTPNQKHL